MKIDNILDVFFENAVIPQKYDEICKYIIDTFYNMSIFCAEFSSRKNIHMNGVPQKLSIEILVNLSNRGEYCSDTSTILIRARKDIRKMKKTIRHELSHVFIHQSLGREANEWLEYHDRLFWQFFRGFDRWNK